MHAKQRVARVGLVKAAKHGLCSSLGSVYTVKLAAAVHVLHCSQKKFTTSIATPKPDLDLIAVRLKAAEAHAKGATS